jgi:hypothetical protein
MEHPRIAKMLMTILAPTLLLAGWGIGLVAQHSMILGGIPPIVFGVVMLPIGFVILALIDAVSSGQKTTREGIITFRKWGYH